MPLQGIALCRLQTARRAHDHSCACLIECQGSVYGLFRALDRVRCLTRILHPEVFMQKDGHAASQMVGKCSAALLVVAIPCLLKSPIQRLGMCDTVGDTFHAQSIK